MLKFDFALQIRNGQRIDSVVIAARDQQEAERKLYQMYRNCTILHCHTRLMAERVPAVGAQSTVEDIVDLIAREK